MAEAERRLGEAERRITAQQQVIEGLKRLGKPTGPNEALLGKLERWLETSVRLRQAILDELAD